jgi:hypothetical protein
MNNNKKSQKPIETNYNAIAFEKIKLAKAFSFLGEGLHRKVYLLEDKELCFKIPKSSIPANISAYWMQVEYLLYQLSAIWDFHVVPFTDIYLSESIELTHICERIRQLHPEIMIEAPIMIQNYVHQEALRNSFDYLHAQKVVFFNWIVGRNDFLRENSKINREGFVIEIDNELVFNDLSIVPGAHWLLEDAEFSEALIEKALLDFILNLSTKVNIFTKQNQIGLEKSRKDKQESEYMIRSILRTIGANLNFVKKIIASLKLERKNITLKRIQEIMNQSKIVQL